MRSSLLLLLLLPACVTRTERVAPSFASGFDVPESDGILVDWHRCEAARPCMDGEWSGRSYALGFKGSPSQVSGEYGGKPLALALEPGSIFRLGDHVIELLYTDASRRAVLTLTWNELEQELLDSRLVVED